MRIKRLQTFCIHVKYEVLKVIAKFRAHKQIFTKFGNQHNYIANCSPRLEKNAFLVIVCSSHDNKTFRGCLPVVQI